MKDFKEDFKKLLTKYRNKENFSFVRFSDGELFVMQDKPLILAQDKVVIGDMKLNFGYNKEDHKFFDPSIEKHREISQSLRESFCFRSPNYYVGISCPCCVSQKENDWMHSLYGEETEFLTWANLFVNANYPLFLKFFLKEFKNRPCVIVCNENASFEDLPFSIEKDFRIGTNAMINNVELQWEIPQWIQENNIKDHTFLLCASSMSNLIAFRSAQQNLHLQNTFLDVGSTLNKFLGMDIARGYLKQFWLSKHRKPENYKYCIWRKQ